MSNLFTNFWNRFFPPAQILTPGTYSYQSPADVKPPLRMHLRIEPDGNGVLIINASTVLHLNQTAVEFAYHRIQGTPETEIVRLVTDRYRVTPEEVKKDLQNFTERVRALTDTPDLDPITFLGMEQKELYSGAISAPYRLDCALTYHVEDGAMKGVTPTERVKRELLTDEWGTILKKAWEAGIPHVVFTGGEPTLRPDLPEIIQSAEYLGQVTGLITSGLQLSETGYLHKLLASGLDHVMIVLDPEDEQAWEALRDTLIEDIFVTVHLTITQKNAGEAVELVKKIQRLGVASISLSAESEELAAQLKVARQTAAELNMELVWDLPVPYSAQHPVAMEQKNHEEAPQGAGKAWLYVEPDGDVLPTQGELRVLGNLLTDDWTTIWKNR
ncbi:radical SAM superfamily [Longilinea arvoryzae]|uniref:Radical SAM superfamily n=1 Tax=Longilinea arvoryzae TaxID=360412 RepID=A0A0S7BFY1_9CHLR|nr:PqqD family peptide modification chaperone [Longilinea arvoryzae]GAP14477.1 radical SAM superfamily [Longilinea arvoryzae]